MRTLGTEYSRSLKMHTRMDHLNLFSDIQVVRLGIVLFWYVSQKSASSGFNFEITPLTQAQLDGIFSSYSAFDQEI